MHVDQSAISRGHSKWAHGLSLIEVVLALSMVAFALPLILMVMGAAAKHAQRSSFAAEAAWLAKKQHFRLTEEHQGRKTTSAIPDFFITQQAQFTESTAPLILLLDAQGSILSAGDTHGYHLGFVDPEARFLVAIYAQTDHDDKQLATAIQQVFMRIQAPPQAPLNQRHEKLFTVLIGPVAPL